MCKNNIVSENEESSNIFEYKCPICGKNFTVLDRGAWVYKQNDNFLRQNMYLCSYSCLKEYRAIYDEKKQKNKEKLRQLRRNGASRFDVYKDGELICYNKTVNEIIQLGLGISRYYIYQCASNGKVAKGYTIKYSIEDTMEGVKDGR